MSPAVTVWFLAAILCAPGIVPAVIFYSRHCKDTGENRFPLGLLCHCPIDLRLGGILGWHCVGSAFRLQRAIFR